MSYRPLLTLAGGIDCMAAYAAPPDTKIFLINRGTSSPVLQLTSPSAGASCAAREIRLTVAPGSPTRAEICENGHCIPGDPNSFTYSDRSSRIRSSEVGLGSGPAAGLVIPVDGPGNLKWLCRNDEEGKQCICIPWFQD
jgi:hypothetical protein